MKERINFNERSLEIERNRWIINVNSENKQTNFFY